MSTSFSFTLIDIINATEGHALQTAAISFSDIIIDGRLAQQGSLYVAIQGTQHDGHDFILQASARGATGMVVLESHGHRIVRDHPNLTVITVKDTVQALGKIAQSHRLSSHVSKNLRVIGITGSYGKTSCKEMLGSILEAHTQAPEQVLITYGNLNNHLGVPLTLLGLRHHHQFAVIEMGMSNLHEIEYLASLSKPAIGIITSVGPAHLETLGTIDNVAKAKGELFFALPVGGIAVFLDGPEHIRIKEQAEQAGVSSHRIVAATASVDGHSTATTKVHVHVISEHIDGIELAMVCEETRLLPKEQLHIQLPLLGSHQGKNAALAATAARLLGVRGTAILQGLEKVSSHHHRGEQIQCAGRLFIDDCYNANPESVKAAAQTLATLPKPGKAWMVLGDMLELGKDAMSYHEQVGVFIASQQIDGLFTIGEQSKATARRAMQAGMPTQSFESMEQLANALLHQSQPGDIIWVKGSRGMQMERLFPVFDELFSRLC